MKKSFSNSAKPSSQIYVVISVIFSLLFHLFIIEGPGNLTITIPGRTITDVEPDESDEPFLIELIPDEPELKGKHEKKLQDSRTSDNGDFYNDVDSDAVDINSSVNDIFVEADLYDPITTEIKFTGIKKDNALPGVALTAAAKTPTQPVNFVPAMGPAPEIIEIPYNELSEERQNLDSRLIKPQKDRIDIDDFNVDSLTIPSDIMVPGGQGTKREIAIRSGRPHFSAPDFDIPNDENGDFSSHAELNGTEITAGGNLGGYEAFDSFVGVNTKIFPDTVGNGGYFEIDIIPNSTSGELRDIPKDLLFIIDRSTSISPEKFRQFQMAVVEALGHLNSKDRFNVVYFNDKTRKIFKHMAPATGRNIQLAEKAIYSIKRGGVTDVFNGLAPFAQGMESDGTRPFNIFIMTDGKSTVNIFKSSDFLKQITATHADNVSIFPFSAGKDANRQLLDYLGYLNRGAKFHVDDINEIHTQLSGFITSHNHMLIQDLKFTTNASFAPEIYPKALPHLYRNEVLKLYGRYENNGDEIVLTLTGKDADGATRDFIMRKKILECQRGDENLPLEWAAQKILWLNALKNCSDDQNEISDLENQIDALRRKFRVYVPNN